MENNCFFIRTDPGNWWLSGANTMTGAKAEAVRVHKPNKNTKLIIGAGSIGYKEPFKHIKPLVSKSGKDLWRQIR